MQLLEKIKEQGWRARPRIVSLRLLFPTIWRSVKFAQLGIPIMNEFLFLDSDVLVMKDLQPLYEACLGIDQPIIGANLWFITEDGGSMASLFCGGEGWVKTCHLRTRPNGQISARTSGGVIFWKISKVLEILQQAKENDFFVQKGEEEEIVIDKFLKYLKNQVYFFSYTFNARPDYRSIGKELWEQYQKSQDPFGQTPPFFAQMLENTKGRDCEDMFNEQAMQSLKSLAADDVAIWHWDGCKHKPAEPECRAKEGSPEQIWRQRFQEVSTRLKAP
ncbi:MAG: glycosyltransferase [Puniceicoccales bacterium]|jgi:hypothetical protein|nr:glycosyltransferase [Puniceicoccales bacterium]